MEERPSPALRIVRGVLGTRVGAGLTLGALACATILPAAAAKIADPDVWWIAAAGREMLATGHVPRQNVFSFVDGAHPWVMHEWLFAVPYALGCGAVGPAFFALVAVAVSVAMLVLLLRQTVLRARHLVAGVLVAALALDLFVQRAGSARPVGAAEVLALAMLPIAFLPRLAARHIAALVALELVWANAHGSFPLGLVILAAGAFASAARARHAAALALATAATFANPYGARLHALVLDYARGASGPLGPLHARVLEYAPVWRAAYHDVVSPLQLAGLGALLVVALFALRKYRARAALVLVLLGEAALHARHAEIAGLLGSVVLLPAIDAWLDAAPKLSASLTPTARAGVVRVVALATLAAALSVFGIAARGRTAGEWISPVLGGESFARLAARVPDGARAYASFRSAGLLIWLDFPRGVRTLYDSRNDCYSRELMDAGLALKDGDASSQQIVQSFDRYRVDYALVADDAYVRQVLPAPDARWSALGQVERALDTAPGWSRVARDGGYTLFARAW